MLQGAVDGGAPIAPGTVLEEYGSQAGAPSVAPDPAGGRLGGAPKPGAVPAPGSGVEPGMVVAPGSGVELGGLPNEGTGTSPPLVPAGGAPGNCTRWAQTVAAQATTATPTNAANPRRVAFMHTSD